MDPKQALGIVDQIVGQVAMNREQHGQAQQAIQVLAIAIAPRVDPEGNPVTPDKAKPKKPRTPLIPG